MNEVSSPHTPENWGSASRGYAEFAPMMMGCYADEVIERLDLQSSARVLEVAAGTGAFTEAIARRAGSVLATDFAPGMIDVLEQKMVAAGVSNVTSAVMDGQALQLDDGSFDRAACCFGIMLFPDRAKGFSELRRVVRSGGRAVVTGWAGLDRFEAYSIFVDGVRAAFPDFPPPPAPPAVLNLSDPAKFAEEMGAGGFEEVDVSFVERTLEIPTFDDLWRMMTAGAPPAKLMFERIGEKGTGHLRKTLATIVEDRFGAGPIRLRNTATLGVGVVP